MPSADLPDELGDCFTVTAARGAGVTRARLRGRDLEPTFYGARAKADSADDADADGATRVYPRTAEVSRIRRRARQYVPVMSSNALLQSHHRSGALGRAGAESHLPAAGRSRAGVSPVRPRHAGGQRDVAGARAAWQRGERSRDPAGDGSDARASEHRSADRQTTWVMLAGMLPHPYDLVAVADHFVRVRRPRFHRPSESVDPPLATIGQLAEAIEAGRRRGGPQLRAALERVRTGSASRTETWTRLTLIDAGLPEPALDVDVFDGEGRWLGRVDMTYPQWRIAVEYEGIHHSAGGQWESDIDRYARLEQAGWKVIRVTRRMLFQFPETIAQRVRAAIAERSS